MARGTIIGLSAHVDAGKTTLSESMLYLSGAVRKQGRVDHGDAFLDTERMEKERGITIFSKQAVLTYKKREITLMDTPGHTDFTGETLSKSFYVNKSGSPLGMITDEVNLILSGDNSVNVARYCSYNK